MYDSRSDIINAVAKSNRQAAKSPTELPSVIKEGRMTKATNPKPADKKAGDKKPADKKPAGGKDTGQAKFPEAVKTENIVNVKSWRQSIESKSTQVSKLNKLIQRTTKVSIEIVRIGRTMRHFGSPMNDAIDDLKIDKKTEKSIESQGSMIGAMTQAVGIIEERIASDLDNPPDGVSASDLKKLRKNYYPESSDGSHYPELDDSKDEPDKPTADKKKKDGEKSKKKPASSK